ncbi:MAG TPA: hypothetical protein VNZ49_07250 [Bacteroidia bacterium]|jgi:hypothetical protein|nr:hypothetical protein [Bacteroidia bacterium]
MKTTFSTPSFKIKISVLALFFLLNNTVFGQRNWKDYLVTGSSMLISGMLDGTIESINYHYDNGFKNRFSKINNQFWDPSLSWKNKYKNGNCELGPKFTGSTTIFACTTDAYHMLRTTKRSIDAFTLVYYMNKTCSEKKTMRKKWKNAATDFLVLTAIRCIGFSLTYSVLFDPHNNYLKN